MADKEAGHNAHISAVVIVLTHLTLQNFRPPTPGGSCTPPTALGLRPWQMSPFASPPLRAISPNSKSTLNQQRDHSACGRGDTPLRVRKTRENLRVPYPDIPPPCSHNSAEQGQDDSLTSVQSTESDLDKPGPVSTPSALLYTTLQQGAVAPPAPDMMPRMQRHKSVSRRMLTKVKQGISNRSKTPALIRPVESDTSLIRRISGRGKQSYETDRRAQSFEVSRNSVVSSAEGELAVALAATYEGSRSFTESSLSTSEVSEDLFSTPPATANGQAAPIAAVSALASPLVGNLSVSPEPTPRPRSKTTFVPTPRLLMVPYVDLTVTLDQTSVDTKTQEDVWVAIDATVRTKVTQLAASGNGECSMDAGAQAAKLGEEQSDRIDVLGAVTSLRLCFKPAHGCCLLDAVGQKAVKDLRVGQKCSLFVRVRVPKLSETPSEADHESLMMELESIVGTLETELLHVEARYRLSLLPHSNVVTVRHIAKIGRPKTESRWSLVGVYNDIEAAEQMHTKLAIHIADHYPPKKALKLIDRFLGREAQQEMPVSQVRQHVAEEIYLQDQSHSQATSTDEGSTRPAVLVTDIDIDSNQASVPASEHLSIASRGPLADSKGLLPVALAGATTHDRTRSVSLSAMTLSPPRQHSGPAHVSDTHTNDAARRVWRHIRRSSLSAKQLAELAPEQMHRLEADDEALMELRRRALANKRSIGAETLKGWKWDSSVKTAEAPWM